MLSQTVLALALAWPMTLQPPAVEPPPVQATAPAQRLDQQLVDRLKQELQQPLADLGWTDDDQQWFAEAILPSLFRPRLKVVLSLEDAGRFNRLNPRMVEQPGFVTKVPLRDDALVVDWVLRSRNYATLAWAPPKGFYLSYNAMAVGLKPGLLRLWIDTRCAQPLAVEPAGRQVASDLAEALAEPALAGERARAVAYILAGARNETVNVDTLAKAATLYAARPDADKWFADYLVGIAEIELAWRDRGTKLAANTTDAQFRGFLSHLAKAETALVRAHNARPNWPEAAQAMITVAMGQGDNARQRPLYWYEQAVKADPADARAASALAYAAIQKWSGAAGAPWIDRIVADASSSRDFTSAVPSMAASVFFDRVVEMQGEEGSVAAAVKEPGVYERLRAVFLGYLTAKDPGVSRDTSRSWLFLLARAADKPADALEALNAPGFTPRPLGSRFDRSPADIRLWATLALSPQSEAIESAEGTLQSAGSDAGLKAFQQITGKLRAGDDAALVQSRISVITHLRQSAVEGKPTEFLMMENAGDNSALSPLCLRASTGGGWSGRIEPVKAAQGVSAAVCFTRVPSITGTTRFNVPAPLDMFKQGYELTFDVDLRPAPHENSPYLYVHINRPTLRANPQQVGPSVQINANGARFDVRHTETAEVLKGKATQGRHHIRILVNGWKAEVWCDNLLADWSTGPQESDNGNTPGAWLSFQDGPFSAGEIRVEHMTIAPLGKPLEDRPARDRTPPVGPKAPPRLSPKR